MNTRPDHVAAALAGGVVCNIGQLMPSEVRQLDRLAKRGQLVKWRGYWHPVSGASYGIGPLKSCWSTAESRAIIG